MATQVEVNNLLRSIIPNIPNPSPNTWIREWFDYSLYPNNLTNNGVFKAHLINYGTPTQYFKLEFRGSVSTSPAGTNAIEFEDKLIVTSNKILSSAKLYRYNAAIITGSTTMQMTGTYTTITLGGSTWYRYVFGGTPNYANTYKYLYNLEIECTSSTSTALYLMFQKNQTDSGTSFSHYASINSNDVTDPLVTSPISQTAYTASLEGNTTNNSTNFLTTYTYPSGFAEEDRVTTINSSSGVPAGITLDVEDIDNVGYIRLSVSDASLVVAGTYTITANVSVDITPFNTSGTTNLTSTDTITITLTLANTPIVTVTEVDSIVTGFKVNGADLNTIFAGLSGKTARANIGFKVNTSDLASLFAKLSDGTASATVTGYKVNGADLNTIFAAKGTLT